MAYTHIFGPVLSGRLGRSLGLDLLGAKICSLDCVYCEVGATRVLTLSRGPYVPAQVLLKELAQFKDQFKNQNGPPLDHITLGGSGEPCLNLELSAILAGAKALFPDVPTAVLTNSTLLSDPAVRQDLAQAEVVLPSLDTLVPAEFAAVSRPHADLTLDGLRQGLLDFRAGFAGRLYLEILLVHGVNDTAANLEALAAFIPELGPDRVDVVTLTRPGTLPTARAVDQDTLAAWRKALGQGAAPAPTPASDQGERGDLRFAELQDMIASSLARRPQTATQLALGLGAPPRLVASALAELLEAGRIADRGAGDPDSRGFYGPIQR